MTAESMSYIGRKVCGCVVAVIVDSDEHRKDTAREIAAWMRDGLTIERVTVANARELVRFCTHDTAPKPRQRRGQPALFEAVP